MAIPSDMEIMACDAFIEISDAAPNGVLWADEYEQASEYARLTWGGSVARRVAPKHRDTVARIERSGSYGTVPAFTGTAGINGDSELAHYADHNEMKGDIQIMLS